MELLNRSLRALQGIYDDPMLPAYQKNGFDMSDESESEDQHQSSSQQGQSQVIENAAENIVIEFNEENRVDIPMSPHGEVQAQDAQEETDDEEEDEFAEEEYRKTMGNIIQIVLYSALKWSTVSVFLCVMLIFTVKWHLPCLYVLLLVSLVDMYSLINTIRDGLRNNSNEKNRYKLRVLQGLLSLGAKISVIIYTYIMPFRLIYSLAPTLTFDFLYAFILMIRCNNPPIKRFYRVQLLLKACYLALVSCVALKLDGIIQWHWREVLMSYWGIFGMTMGVTIVTILVFLNKFLSFFLIDRRNFEFYGILWLTLFFSGITACSGLITYKLQKVLEHELNPSVLLPLFIITAVYSIGFTVFTTIHFKKLEAFFKKAILIDEEQQALVSPSAAEKKENDKPPSPKKLVIPRFLTKSSNTYFRKVTQNDIDRNKARMNRLKAKNAKFKVKQPRQRQNSFDQGVNKNTWIRNFALVPNPELLTIPETDRDKLRTEVLTTTRQRGRDDIKPLNLLQKKGFEGLTSLPSDRSRAGLIGSYRSTVGFNENTNGEDTTGTLASARRREDKLDSFRGIPDLGLNGNLSPDDPDKIIEADEEDKGDDGFSLFLEDIRPLSARRANSLNAIPDPKQTGLPLILESESNKENSRLEASEMMTSPTLDASTTQQCLICFDKPPDAVFMECGHGGVCYECSLEIWKTTLECYLCRKKINQVLQIDPKHKIGKHIIKVVSATQMVMCDNQNQNQNQNANQNANPEGQA